MVTLRFTFISAYNIFISPKAVSWLYLDVHWYYCVIYVWARRLTHGSTSVDLHPCIYDIYHPEGYLTVYTSGRWCHGWGLRFMLDKLATYTSAYHHLPNSSVSKCCMWIEALGIGTLPVHLTPVEERTILLVAYPNQLLRHLSELAVFVLGNPLFFHASRGLMEVELTSDHCWLWGFLGYGRTLLAILLWVPGSEVWNDSGAPPGNLSFGMQPPELPCVLASFS